VEYGRFHSNKANDCTVSHPLHSETNEKKNHILQMFGCMSDSVVLVQRNV